QALGQQRENLSLALREAVRTSTRRHPGAARNTARTLDAQLLAQGACRWGGAEASQDRQRLPLLGFGSVPGQHAAVFIGAAQVLPGAGRPAPVARDFQRVGFRNICWELL